ncbi:MAG: modulator protein, partial [Tardiphaga sp.]|nr:modulator protein [Tardiphaga sp.]
APSELLARDQNQGPDLDLIDTYEPSPETLRAIALEAEDAARAIGGVTNSDGGSASSGSGVFALATSHGFSGAYGSTSHSISASVVGGEGADKQRDNAWRSAHHHADLPSPAEIGRLAGERTVAKLNPGKLRSGTMPVVFDPRVSASLVGHLLGAISGSAIARRSSFLLDKLGEPIFAPGITIADNPHVPRGLRSRLFDGEGLPTSSRNLVEDGRVTGWLLDSASARQLNLAPTGHAARSGGGAPGVSTGNVHLAAGTLSPAELMADIADGVYVTELIGQGVNGVTGDYSRGAAGFWIENGKLTYAVSEVTIAGHLLDIFKSLTPANDLAFRYGVNAPTVRIEGLTIAGR